MKNTQSLGEITKELLIELCDTKFKKERKKTYTPLDHIFPDERKTHSVMTGLLTSLGQSMWEKLAKRAAEQNGFEIKDHKKGFNQSVPKIPKDIQSMVDNFCTTREDQAKPDESLESLKKTLEPKITKTNLNALKHQRITKGYGVDLWIAKENHEYMYDIKTVQINAAGGNSFNRTLANWHAWRLLQDPAANLTAAIAFPYNPYMPDDFWPSTGGKCYPLKEKVDALVGDEFWSFISGKKEAMGEIIQAFKDLGKEGTLEKYKEQFH